ncbi:hypothetical protein ACWEOE_40110 [Amycolatopsis sp. NPDC004368]
MKLSTGKRTLPGAKQVYRGAAGEPDVLATTGKRRFPGREALLIPVVLRGRRLEQPGVSGSRRRREHDLAWLPPAALRLRRPEPVGVVHSAALESLAEDVAARVREDQERAATVAR